MQIIVINDVCAGEHEEILFAIRKQMPDIIIVNTDEVRNLPQLDVKLPIPTPIAEIKLSKPFEDRGVIPPKYKKKHNRK